MIRNQKEWNDRLLELKNIIKKYIDKILDKEIINEYLFYDSVDN